MALSADNFMLLYLGAEDRDAEEFCQKAIRDERGSYHILGERNVLGDTI